MAPRALDRAQYARGHAASPASHCVAAGWPLPTHRAAHLVAGTTSAGWSLAWSAYFVITTGINAYVDSPAPRDAVRRRVLRGLRLRGVLQRRGAGRSRPLVALVTATSVWWLPLLLPPLVAIYARPRRSPWPGAPGQPRRAHGAAQPQAAPARAASEALDARSMTPARWRCSCSTSTGSRRSTTPSGTASATGCLQLVAERLPGAVRPEDMVARLGGDEFAVLLPRCATARSPRSRSPHRLRTALDEPFRARGRCCSSSRRRVGIALVPRPRPRRASSCSGAPTSRCTSPRRSAPASRSTPPTRDRHSTSRLGMLGALRRAIDGDELELHYQPKLSLRTGAVIGVEALVRWRHPQRGPRASRRVRPAGRVSPG